MSESVSATIETGVDVDAALTKLQLIRKRVEKINAKMREFEKEVQACNDEAREIAKSIEAQLSKGVS